VVHALVKSGESVQCDRAQELLRWQPQLDDLATIVAHALAWKRKLGTLENG
jgi:UDP-glucose 4-epimerase